MYQYHTIKAAYLDIETVKKLKKHPQNRTIRQPQVNRILTAIEREQRITEIVVNSQTNTVIDGQHRIAAYVKFSVLHPELAKSMMIPCVYIDIPQESEFAEIILRNSTPVKWGTSDYINAFADAGYESYVRLRDFMKSCNLCHGMSEDTRAKRITSPKVTNALALLGIPYETTKYKAGMLEVAQDEIEIAQRRAKEINSILEAVDPQHTIGTRSITYLIGAWVYREKADIGLSSEQRSMYIVSHKKEIREYVKESGNKLSKSSDWNNLFNMVASQIYSQQRKGMSGVA